ncbi:hypothetical protein [Vreelandella sulfidaeris]
MKETDIPTCHDKHVLSVHVDVDSNGGGELFGYSSVSIAIASPQLQYLDVVGCTSLAHLDLSQCQPDCHITLQNCPSLQFIHVPKHGNGAVLHLDSGHHMPFLKVEGCVDHFDACWVSGQCSVKSVGAPWQGVWISHHLTNISQTPLSLDSECWIILSPATPHLVIDAPQVRFCYLSGGSQLETLSIVSLSSQQSQIEAQALPELCSVDIHPPTTSLYLRDCHSLMKLSGGVTDIHLSHVSQRADILQIEMTSERLMLCHSDVEALVIKEPTELSLLHCRPLNRVSLAPMTNIYCEGAVPESLIGVATVVVDESMVKSLVSAYPQHSDVIMVKLTKLIPSMSPSGPCVKALQLLQKLSELDAPLEQLWKIRLDLSAMHLASRTKRRRDSTSKTAIALSHWKWQLPDDLCREGWQSDYQLWAKCAPVVPEAFYYRHAMVRACGNKPDGLAMQTVVYAMARHSNFTHTDELDLWCDVMDVMATKEPLSVVNWALQARMLTARYGMYQRLDRAYLAACENLLHLKDLLDVLARIGCHHPEVRACLLNIAQRPWYWREERCDNARQADNYRAKAIALAISRAD